MSVRQVLVDEAARWKRLSVQLSRRKHHLPVSPVDHVAIVIDRDEVVVSPDLLELPESLKERLSIPEPDVLDSHRVLSDVVERQGRVAAERAGLDAVEIPCLPGGVDVMLKLRCFTRELGRFDKEALDRERKESASDDAHGQIPYEREESEPHDLATDHPVNDHRCSEESDNRGDVERGKRCVQVGVTRADQRAGRRIQQLRYADDPDLNGSQQQESNKQRCDVFVRRRLEPDSLRWKRHATPHEVQYQRSDERDDHERAQHAEHCRYSGQNENVKADVPAEDRVGGTKRRGVHQAQHVHPVAGRCHPEKQCDEKTCGLHHFRQRTRDIYRRQLRADSPENRSFREATGCMACVQRDEQVGNHSA